MSKNRNKKSDNLSDLIYSVKSPAQADVGEVFLNRLNGKLSYKRSISEIRTLTDQETMSLLAVNTSYDNSGSGLTATNVQAAIDEVVTMIPVAPTPTVSSVTLTNLELSDLDSTPVLLVPAPPAGNYYDWELKFEFTNGNQQYSFDRSMYLTDGVNNFNYIHHSTINGAVKRIWYVKEPGSDFYNAVPSRVEIIGVVPDAAIYLTAVAGFSSPSGNGTLKITSTYTEHTFGA